MPPLVSTSASSWPDPRDLIVWQDGRLTALTDPVAPGSFSVGS